MFDLVQPGLLGALEQFGKTYWRPIECQTDEQMVALKRLQAAIAPQTLRRTKADIAEDLPNKFFAWKKAADVELQFKPTLAEHELLEIALTEHQRILYKGGLKKLQDAANESNGRKRAQLSFGALHLMKAVCAEPYCLPGTKFIVDKAGREPHLANSPKLSWLLSRLAEVQRAGEKAIVFSRGWLGCHQRGDCRRREVSGALQGYEVQTCCRHESTVHIGCAGAGVCESGRASGPTSTGGDAG